MKKKVDSCTVCSGDKVTKYSLTKKRIGIGFLALVGMAILAGCGGGEPADHSMLNRGLISDPDSFDPQKSTSVQGHRVFVDLYEGLLRHSPTGELIGGVARDWSVSSDGLTYTFLLNPAAKWSNGDRVTARDFEFSLKRLVDPKSAAFYAAFVSSIVNAPEIIAGDLGPDELGVSAESDDVLTIRLSKPTAYFAQLLTHPSTAPLHRGSIEEHGSAFTRPENLLTNGAYLLRDFIPSTVVRLEKNPYYRNSEDVAIEKVNYIIAVDSDTMFNRYRAGELDITTTVPAASFARIKEQMADELKIAPQLGLYYYAFNLTKSPFGDNKKLRQALSMVVDREVLVNRILGRGEVAAYSWVPPGIEGYEPPQLNFVSMSMDERIEEARRLYREAGFSDENPAKFELRYNVSEGETTIAVAVRSMWKQALGAEAELVNEEYRVLISNIQQMTITEAYRLSWIGDYFDPHTFLQLMETNNPQNLTGYSNTTFDELMKQTEVTIDADQRMRLFREAEAIMLDDHAAIPLYFYVSKHLVRNNVKGWHTTTLDFHPSQYLSLAE